jgi:putative DNA-invertase from lambdoid prophage Rac
MKTSEATKDAQRAGIARAKANDTTAHRRRKPSFSRQQFDGCKRSCHRYDERQRALSHVGLRRMAVAHIKAGPAAAEAMLASWACKPRQLILHQRVREKDACRRGGV